MEPTLAETGDDIVRRWLPALFEGLDECTTEEQRIKILEHGGRACGQPDLEEVRRIREEARDQEHLLQLINERIPWCGEWVGEDGKIHTVCTECGCPLVVGGVPGEQSHPLSLLPRLGEGGVHRGSGGEGGRGTAPGHRQGRRVP